MVEAGPRARKYSGSDDGVGPKATYLAGRPWQTGFRAEISSGVERQMVTIQ